MQSDIKKITIEDKEYQIGKLTIRKGLKVFIELLKIVGASAGKGFKGASFDKPEDLEIELGDMIETFVDRINEDNVYNLIVDLTSQVTIKGSDNFIPVDIERDFGGDYVSLFEVVKESIKFNYSGFLGKALPMIQKIGKAKKKK